MVSPIPQPEATDSRFDRRLSEILDFATEIFAEKGYEGASIRDLSRRSGISLAGLYYYFGSKEKLLYSIQKHTFIAILQRLRERLAGTPDPEQRLRIFVLNHVEYALSRPHAMKVLSHEDDVLKNGYGAELAAIKREYYRACVELVEALVKTARPRSSSKAQDAGIRTTVMGLFGMINWLHTWYNPRTDPAPNILAGQISDLFLQGVRGYTASTTRRSAPDRSKRIGAAPGKVASRAAIAARKT